MALGNISKNHLRTSIMNESSGDRHWVVKQPYESVLRSYMGYTMTGVMVAYPLFISQTW